MRVLVVTADVGEGHTRPAACLAAELRAEHPAADVAIADGLTAMGPLVREPSTRLVGSRSPLGQWAWDAEYWLFARFPPAVLTGKALLHAVAAGPVSRLVRRARPDVVVSAFPQTTEVLGWLRRHHRLPVPVCALVTDLAGLHYKAAAGIDLHLVAHPAAIAEVHRVAGPGSEARCVRGLTDRRFLRPPSMADARHVLGLPAGGQIAIVSGGGWAVGDLAGAVDVALSAQDVSMVVCLCGRNESRRLELAERYRDNARVRVEGYTEQMPDWMAAAGVLIHSSSGLTVLEAAMCGCPAVSYGWPRAHVRQNDEAYQRLGIAHVARSPAELAATLPRVFSLPRRPDRRPARWPSAASLVLALAAPPADGQAASPARR